MHKTILFKILIFLLPIAMFGHTLLLNIDDNEDGTITVQGKFNTGQSASGAQVRLESLISGEVLYKKRLPDESELVINIPKEPYQIVLDGGPGHQVVKEGITPEGGFSKEMITKKDMVKVSKPKSSMQSLPLEIIISIAVAFLLFFLTIIISIKNTDKLIKELQSKR